MSPPPEQDFEPFGDTAFGDPDPARRLRDTIAPGTFGDPYDTMDDFPLIRDAKPQAERFGERRRSNGNEELPPPSSEADYGFASGDDQVGTLERRAQGSSPKPEPAITGSPTKAEKHSTEAAMAEQKEKRP